MPTGGFYDLHRLPSWSQYSIASKSLLGSLGVDNPEETLLLQVTISELSLLSLGLLMVSRIFPEFAVLADELSTKVAEVSEAQNFLRGTGDDE